ncbi:nitrile hydratase subunit beta [Solirubrobacter ginsenosidimutans]|uniref:Nitrile hydratase subunit beta n=1 Tax=Solirubrobacter ginsenosidimutans TaxID=490573 RepID=A0A9X3S3W6_9ACTN|nr:nitrile hydratase subunit beta [Solirubrobacter ginsenosidimutans]MDA0162541.1 nitrile hydratase subunit beta [Solirubrobacter ginsenosidimutans]
MNGAHDMGGAHGFGPVVAEVDEPWFHAEWERRVFAMVIATGAGGLWNIDAGRFAREDRPPGEYLDMSYFEIWLAGLERLLAERGYPSKVLAAADVPAAMARGGPATRPSDRPARFAVGDRVRTRNTHPHTHTRLPRYARGRVGTVERLHGTHVFPDSNAHFAGEDPQWLYTVRFTARELWGSDAPDSVSIDAFEPYLEPA